MGSFKKHQKVEKVFFYRNINTCRSSQQQKQQLAEAAAAAAEEEEEKESKIKFKINGLINIKTCIQDFLQF